MGADEDACSVFEGPVGAAVMGEVEERGEEHEGDLR